MAGFELTHLLNLRAAGAAEVRQAVAATFFLHISTCKDETGESVVSA